MQASQAAFDIIMEFEGLRLEAYQDSGGVWTIGYGHTQGVRQGDTITEAEAERLLDEDVTWAEDAVNRHVHVDLTQAQFDALVSFIYNIGAPRFRKSTLLRKLNKGNYGAVPKELARWDKGTVKRKNPKTGRVRKVKTQIAGLARRRAAEAKLWAADGEDIQAKPDTVDDRPSRSREVQGAGVSGVGALGAAASEAAGQIQPLAQHSDILMYAFVGLTLVGVAVVIYSKLKSED